MSVSTTCLQVRNNAKKNCLYICLSCQFISICECVISNTIQIILEFSTWDGNSEELETEAVSDEIKSSMDKFLIEHSEIYDELTKMRQHYDRKRLGRKSMERRSTHKIQIRKIMQYAAALSNRPIDNVGSIVVATHDGDFTVVARAFEERFGFGIAKNSRTLKQWLREQ